MATFSGILTRIEDEQLRRNKEKHVIMKLVSSYVFDHYPNISEGHFGVINEHDKELAFCFYYDLGSVELDTEPHKDMILIFV